MNVTGFLLCVTAIQTLTIVGMTIVQHIERKEPVIQVDVQKYDRIQQHQSR